MHSDNIATKKFMCFLFFIFSSPDKDGWNILHILFSGQEENGNSDYQ